MRWERGEDHDDDGYVMRGDQANKGKIIHALN